MEDGDEYPEVAWSRLLKMNALEWPYMTIGGIASVISGLVWPTFAYFFGLTVQVKCLNTLYFFKGTLFALILL